MKTSCRQVLGLIGVREQREEPKQKVKVSRPRAGGVGDEAGPLGHFCFPVHTQRLEGSERVGVRRDAGLVRAQTLWDPEQLLALK